MTTCSLDFTWRVVLTRRARLCAVVACLFIGVLQTPARAEIRMPGFMTDHMVLQRDARVPLWGWGAGDGEKVLVRFQGQEVATVARDGKWSLELAPLQAGGPFVLQVSGPNNNIEIKEVMVGDVWISCGQSNMMMSLNGVEGGRDAIAESGQYPDIRLVNIPVAPNQTKPLDDVVARWAPADGRTLGGFSAVSYFFGRELNKELKVPIGLINVVAIVQAHGWIDEDTLRAEPALCGQVGQPAVARSYNAGIAPLRNYGMRGAIYYQGEANVGYGAGYRTHLSALIKSWRSQWNKEFPFLFVQLPGLQEHRAAADRKLDMSPELLAALRAPGQSSAWAELREAQLRTWQTVPNTGMAITIDVGDRFDIHPTRKKPVGERLALAARAVAYGQNIEYSGPIVSQVAVQGNTVVVQFQHARGLKSSEKTLQGFEISGPDNRYVPAFAEIRGASVAISSPEVAAPAKIRYAWANYPQATLYNAADLPASPFRAMIPGNVVQNDTFTTTMDQPMESGPEKIEARLALRNWNQRWNADIVESDQVRPGTVYRLSLQVKKIGVIPLHLLAFMTTMQTMGIGTFDDGGRLTVENETTQEYVQVGTRTQDMRAGSDNRLGYRFFSTKGAGTVAIAGPVEWIRPKLGVSETSPIELGEVRPGVASAPSTPRRIFNSQQEVAAGTSRKVPTILYGAWNISVKPCEAWMQSSDHVDAKIIGNDAARFEIVAAHPGATAQEMKLLGGDGKEGLRGGPEPEFAEFQIKFLGGKDVRDYAATLRIVTQAGNSGVISQRADGEPLEGLFYVDIPLKATVK